MEIGSSLDIKKLNSLVDELIESYSDEDIKQWFENTYPENKMTTVDKETFYNFLRGKKVDKKETGMAYADYFIDESGEPVAYMEISPYGTDVIYKIKNGLVNYETIGFIGGVIKNKMKRWE